MNRQGRQKSNEIIISGFYSPIRNFENPLELDVSLTKILYKISASYGGRKEIDSDILDACLELLTDEYDHLGIDEISEAYKLFAAGKFKTDDGKMFGGQFNAYNMGRVLSEYENYRKKLLENHLSSERDKEFNMKLDENTEKGKNIIRLMKDYEFIREVEKCSKWEEIPKWVIDPIADRKLIKRLTDEEKEEYLTRAKTIADVKIEEEKAIASTYKFSQDLRNAIEKIEANKDGRIKGITNRLIIFERLEHIK